MAKSEWVTKIKNRISELRLTVFWQTGKGGYKEFRKELRLALKREEENRILKAIEIKKSLSLIKEIGRENGEFYIYNLIKRQGVNSLG